MNGATGATESNVGESNNEKSQALMTGAAFRTLNNT